MNFRSCYVLIHQSGNRQHYTVQRQLILFSSLRPLAHSLYLSLSFSPILSLLFGAVLYSFLSATFFSLSSFQTVSVKRRRKKREKNRKKKEKATEGKTANKTVMSSWWAFRVPFVYRNWFALCCAISIVCVLVSEQWPESFYVWLGTNFVLFFCCFAFFGLLHSIKQPIYVLNSKAATSTTKWNIGIYLPYDFVPPHNNRSISWKYICIASSSTFDWICCNTFTVQKTRKIRKKNHTHTLEILFNPVVKPLCINLYTFYPSL